MSTLICDRVPFTIGPDLENFVTQAVGEVFRLYELESIAHQVRATFDGDVIGVSLQWSRKNEVLVTLTRASGDATVVWHLSFRNSLQIFHPQ